MEETVEVVEETVKPVKPAKTPKAKKAKQLKITLVKSVFGAKPNQRKTIEALGLTKINSSKVQPDNEAIRGMIFTVKHLVSVEEI